MWHADDRFWKTYGPFMFDQRRWEGTPAEVDAILKLLKPPAEASILDLCCGPGRHALELARRGFDVVGVDRTSAYLAEAKKRAKADQLKIEFVKDDMRRFRRDGAFDAIINMYTAFGYFERPGDDRRVLMNIRRSLKAGGILLMDLLSKEIIARGFRERDWHEDNGAILLEHRKVTQNWSWMENRRILIQGNHRKEFTISHRIYSAAELTDLLRDCGFTKIKVYGDLAGADYNHDAKRLIVLARKMKRNS